MKSLSMFFTKSTMEWGEGGNATHIQCVHQQQLAKTVILYIKILYLGHSYCVRLNEVLRLILVHDEDFQCGR